MNKIAKFIKTQATIVRIPGFSIESDAFVFLIDKLEKDHSLASKIYNKAWDIILTGRKDNAKLVILPDAQKFITKVWEDYSEFVIKKIDRYMFLNTEFKSMSAKILAAGIVNELVNDPNHYKKFLSTKAQKEVEDYVVNRGKSKFVTMLQNKGF